MVDAVIILIVLVLLFIALKGSVKHFKGEGACCSGSSSTLLKTAEKFRQENWPPVGQSTALPERDCGREAGIL